MGTTCHALITAPGANMVPERCGLAPSHAGECKSEAAVLRTQLAEVSKETASGIAKWLTGPVAASMFGSTTWSTRQGLAPLHRRRDLVRSRDQS